MRQKLIAGNWKMHGTQKSNKSLLDALCQQNPLSPTFGEMVVFVPFPYLAEAREILAGSTIALGAQNLSAYADGAYTGEVSGAMLQDVGCRYVLVGHSERRTLFAESDADVAAKFVAAQSANLCPVLCVGESLAAYQAGETFKVVEKQLATVIDKAGVAAFNHAVIAYEPVWAIGTGLVAAPAEIEAVHAALREKIASKDADVAVNLRILYGGSVKADNAASLFVLPDVDGVLVGGASRQANDFIAIASAALSSTKTLFL